MNESLIVNAQSYGARRQLEIAERLGSGKDGTVFVAKRKIASAKVAIKAHRFEELYFREKLAYEHWVSELILAQAMAKQGEPENNPYRLNHYSISELLHLVNSPRAKKVLLEVDYTPILFVKEQKIEIDGPDVTIEVMEELLHSVATTRQIRSLRKNGAVEFVHIFKQHEILMQFVEAFGVYRVDLTPMASIWSKLKE